MEAYILQMKGTFLLEKEHWQEALDALLRAKLIYQKISEFKDSLEAVIYIEKIG